MRSEGREEETTTSTTKDPTKDNDGRTSTFCIIGREPSVTALRECSPTLRQTAEWGKSHD